MRACSQPLSLLVELRNRLVNADGSPRRVFARVNYREDAPGVIDGTAYAFVDHFATTSGSFARPPQHGSEVGTS